MSMLEATTVSISKLRLESIVDKLYRQFEPRRGVGVRASYIPPLSEVPADKFGVAVQTLDGYTIAKGDADEPFSIQSVSKLFAFVMAFKNRGRRIWSRVGKEPSGAAFNALFQLEAERGIPRNPFVNAGAMAMCDLLLDDYENPMDELLAFIASLTGDDSLSYDSRVYRSELECGHRNASLAHLMSSFGTIHHSVEEVLELYCKQCSITMSCQQLAQAIQFLANQGVNPLNQERILTISRTKRTNALLLTAGLYNEAGDFAFRVGIPAKSGVGGGIAALIPNYLTVVTWAPGLNERGNSLLGIDFLEEFTTRTGLSVF